MAAAVLACAPLLTTGGVANVLASPDAATATLSASGLRGPVWFGHPNDKESGWVVGGDKTGALPIAADGTVAVEAPIRVADRVFRGWKLGRNWVSREARPTMGIRLRRGAKLEAVYEPSPLGAEPRTAHFAQPNGGRWGGWPRKVHVDPQLPAEIRAAIWDGIRRWDIATGGAIRIEAVRDDASADIAVMFTDLPDDRSGQTTSRGRTAPDGRFNLESSKVYLSTALVEDDDPRYLEGIAAVASHEVGHALGLSGKPTGGHSDDPRDTMAPTVSSKTKWPTSRDLTSLAHAYPDRFSGR